MGLEKHQDEHWDGTGPASGWGVRERIQGFSRMGPEEQQDGMGKHQDRQGEHRDGTGRQVQDHRAGKEWDQREAGAGTGGDTGLGQWR